MSDNSHEIAKQQIDLLADGHVSEDMAGWCFRISHGVQNACNKMPLSQAEKVRALRLSSVLLLNLAAEVSE